MKSKSSSLESQLVSLSISLSSSLWKIKTIWTSCSAVNHTWGCLLEDATLSRKNACVTNCIIYTILIQLILIVDPTTCYMPGYGIKISVNFILGCYSHYFIPTTTKLSSLLEDFFCRGRHQRVRLWISVANIKDKIYYNFNLFYCITVCSFWNCYFKWWKPIWKKRN